MGGFLFLSDRERQVRVEAPPVLQRRGVASCLMGPFSVTTSFSSQQPLHSPGLSGPLECALFREGERGILQTGRRGQRAGARKAMENQEPWVPKHNPRGQDARLLRGPAGLPCPCPCAGRGRSGGIFSSSSPRHLQGKVTSRSKRRMAPSDKRIAPRGTDKLLLTPGCGLGGEMGA